MKWNSIISNREESRDTRSEEEIAPSRRAGEKEGRADARKRRRRHRLGIRRAKLIGLNYEPLFNCTPGVCRINKPAPESGKSQTTRFSMESLIPVGAGDVCFTTEFGVACARAISILVCRKGKPHDEVNKRPCTMKVSARNVISSRLNTAEKNATVLSRFRNFNSQITIK